MQTTVEKPNNGKREGIAVAGNILTDIVKQIDFYPEKGMLSSIRAMSRAVGGCVPNTGIDLAIIDPQLRLGALGRVGDDESGSYVVSELVRHGIDVSGVSVSPDAPTSFSDVMSIVSTGERTFFHHRGANAEFCPAHVDLSRLRCRMLHIGYILLLDQFDKADAEYGTVMARFLKSVRDAGIETSVDLVSSSDGGYEKAAFALRYTDYAFMNEVEGSGIAGIPVRDADGKLLVDSVRRTMEVILDMGVGKRVILHCPEAGFCMNADRAFFVVPSLALEPGYIKGSVGAGDAFCAGCLYGIYQGYDEVRMLEFASGAAACNLAAKDSVSGMRDKSYILDFIANHGKITL